MKSLSEGRKIFLNIDAVRQREPLTAAPIVLYFIFFVLLIVLPVWFLLDGSGTALAAMSLLFAALILSVAYLSWSFYQLRSPISYSRNNVFKMSPRIFFPGAILCLLAASVGPIWIYCVVASWFFVEWVSYRRSAELDDQTIAKAYSNSFKTEEDGTISFDPLQAGSYRTLRSSSGSASLVYETLPAMIFVMVGPALFIRSQILRDNFEARFVIAAIFAYAAGLATSGVLTDFYIVARALKLKQRS